MYGKRWLYMVLFIGSFANASAQERMVVEGTVFDVENKKTVESANVSLQSKDGKSLYGFALTDAQGKYRIVYHGMQDSLAVFVSGFNVKSQRCFIANVSQTVDFHVEMSNIQIREVVVVPKAIERRQDTISYNVLKFKDLTDRSIGDVLRKMPGIEVYDNGSIFYNGKAINKFYVEGMDMFDGRYGIATNNIRAEDITNVEVLERHQPVKVLRELDLPDAAALNLRLKQNAKGIWSGNVGLGIGYEPVLWDIQGSGMHFSHNFQMINLYKSNNAGYDLANEIVSHYRKKRELEPLLEIRMPDGPNIDQQLYLDNRAHLLSTNAIKRLGNVRTLMANAYYFNDNQEKEGHEVSTYYRPDLNPLVITEENLSRLSMNHAGFGLKMETNKDKYYMQESFSFYGKWENGNGHINSGAENVTQKLDSETLHFLNDFRLTKKKGVLVLDFISQSSYENVPSVLHVTPLIYPEIVGELGKQSTGITQQVENSCWSTYNVLESSYISGKWNFYAQAVVDMDWEKLETELFPMGNRGTALPDMCNDLSKVYANFSVVPGVRFKSGKGWDWKFNIPLGWHGMMVDRNGMGKNESVKHLYASPSFFLNINLTRKLSWNIGMNYNEHYGTLHDLYQGFIMTDYRTIGNMDDKILYMKEQAYFTSLRYSNILRSLFASLNIFYQQSRKNLMQTVNYEGTLSRIQSVYLPNTLKSLHVDGQISKYLSSLHTTLRASCAYSHTWSNVMREQQLMKSSMGNLRAEMGSNIRLTSNVLLDYNISFLCNKIGLEGFESTVPIRQIRQEGALSFIICQKAVVAINGEHYYNESIAEGSRNIFFLHAKAQLNYRRMKYSLNVRNLLGQDNFYTAKYTDAMQYVYTYSLRKPSIMFTIGFDL